MNKNGLECGPMNLIVSSWMHRFILTYGIDEENQQTSSRCQAFFVKISIRIIHANESNMFQWMAEEEEENQEKKQKKRTGFEME